uniref:Secreted Cyclase-like protein n=1 Tax=Pristhesancus plagipennis TaxID=1955184 RepID=A0A2K8JSF8_PRIPG|nr:secreted Cyclase-like protein [Pristhesancus plagipennis]
MMKIYSTIFLLSAVILQCSAKLTPIDLGFGYENDTVYFPGGSPFSWTNKRFDTTESGVPYASFDFQTSEHSGTHIDAPYHFKKDGRTVDQIPLEKLLVTGILINATAETGTNSSYVLPSSKLIEWERENGEIPDNSVVFINFGWSEKFYPDRKKYLGPSDKELKFPSLSPEAAQWIASTKRVVGVGVDSASPDIPGQTSAHVLFANSDMYILENLNLAKPLPPKFHTIIMPMKLVGGTGGPVRVVAFINT